MSFIIDSRTLTSQNKTENVTLSVKGVELMESWAHDTRRIVFDAIANKLLQAYNKGVAAIIQMAL
jgi:hypothetical protein